MFSLATKLHLALAGFAGACALVYMAAVGDRSGWVLLLIAGCAFLVAALAGLAGDVDDRAIASSDGDATEVAVTPDAAGQPSVWPLAAAVAATAFAVSLAYGAVVFTLAAVLAAVALGGWFARVWREHPTFTPKVARRLDDRLVAPVLLPVGTFLVVLFIGAGISRVLLAVNADMAALIAIVVAIVLIAGLYLIAARPNLSSSALTLIGVVALAALLAGGVAGAAKGERAFHHEAEGHEPVEFIARQVQFVEPQGELTVEAGSDVSIRFVNEDVGIYHNVAVYEEVAGPDGSTLQGAPIFNGKPIPSGELDYKFKAPKRAGTYLYICDFHTNMKGELVVR